MMLLYGGPGAVIAGIAALAAVAGTLVASFMGFVWLPLKALVRRWRGDDD